MGRLTAFFVIPALIVLIIYQHYVIQKVEKHAVHLLQEMQIEYSKRNDDLDKIVTDKRMVEMELSRTESELKNIEKTLRQARSQLTVLGDNDKTIVEKINMLLENRQTLESRISLLTAQKEALERKFQDLDILKEAIKDVKRKQKEQKLSLLKSRDRKILASGNKGFITREGVSTLRGHGTTVQVTPAPLSALAKESQI